MAHTHIELTDEQITALKKLATARNITLPQLIQEGIKKLIGEPAPQYTPGQKKRALAIIGSFESTETDLSINHDAYFVDTIQQ